MLPTSPSGRPPSQPRSRSPPMGVLRLRHRERRHNPAPSLAWRAQRPIASHSRPSPQQHIRPRLLSLPIRPQRIRRARSPFYLTPGAAAISLLQLRYYLTIYTGLDKDPSAKIAKVRRSPAELAQRGKLCWFIELSFEEINEASFHGRYRLFICLLVLPEKQIQKRKEILRQGT